MFAQVNETTGINNLICTVTGFRPTYGRYDEQSQTLTILFAGGDDGCEDVITGIADLKTAKRQMCNEVIASAREVANQIY